MPSKKKKYNTRFPASRIKKIMQTDEEIGKVAQAVPIIISRTLELFVESLLRQSMHITQSRNAKTLTPSHMKQSILAESKFDFLKDLVKNVPDASVQEDNENDALEIAEALDYSIAKPEPKPTLPELPPANYYKEQQPSDSNVISSRTPVIQFSPKYTELTAFPNEKEALPKTHPSNSNQNHTQLHTIVTPQQQQPQRKINFFIERLVSSSSPNNSRSTEVNSSSNTSNQYLSSASEITPHLHLDFSHLSATALATGTTSNNGATVTVPTLQMTNHIIGPNPSCSSCYTKTNDDSGNVIATSSLRLQIPPQPPNSGDNLYIDEDYDN